jgi:hypothetical protein
MTQEKQLTIRDVVLISKDWFSYFIKFWKLIVIAGFLGAGIGFLIAYMDKPVYTAELTLALEEKNTGSPYAGIASQFGVDLGAAGGGGAFSGDNNIELLKSRSLIEKSLLTPVMIDGKEQLLINRYIDFNELRDGWKEKPDLKDIVYTAGEPRENFGIKKDSILYQIYKHIKMECLSVARIDKKVTIIRIDMKSQDQLFAKAFTEVLVETASAFYIQTKTKRSKTNLDILEARLDSVKQELDKSMYGAAASKDQNILTIRAAANIQSAKKQLNVQVLTTMYGELIKNTEMAKYALLRDEPLVQIIDRPVLPLDKKKKGKLMGLIVGGMTGGFIILAILWLKRMWAKVMGDPQ